jgi:hypothetical protein
MRLRGLLAGRVTTDACPPEMGGKRNFGLAVAERRREKCTLFRQRMKGQRCRPCKRSARRSRRISRPR